jgi:hypothetical protein
MLQSGEPPLEQWGRRREDEKRCTQGGGEQQNQPRDRIAASRRHPSLGHRDGKNEERAREQRQVADGLTTGPEVAGGKVGVEVATEQRGLKVHEAGVPDRWGPAQEREHHSGEERLHPEEEKGAAERGQREEGGHEVRAERLVAAPADGVQYRFSEAFRLLLGGGFSDRPAIDEVSAAEAWRVRPPSQPDPATSA